MPLKPRLSFHQSWYLPEEAVVTIRNGLCERYVNDTYESYDYPIIRYAEVLLNYAKPYSNGMELSLTRI